MTPDRLAALRAFIASTETRLPSAVDAMYGSLFETLPDAQSLFKGDLYEQKVSFTLMLQHIVKLTRSSQLWPVSSRTGQATLPVLNELRERHANAGVTPEHFEKMKIVLSHAFEQIAPAEFTPPVAEALGFVFDVLARSLTMPQTSAPGDLVSKLHQPGTELHDPGSYFDYEPQDTQSC